MGILELEEYKFESHDDVESVFSIGEGLTEEVICEMSRIKDELEQMLEFRPKSLETFNKMSTRIQGPDLPDINFDVIKYYQKPGDESAHDWGDVSEEIRGTFEKIDTPEVGRAYLTGASTQYESETVYHNVKNEFEKLGIVLTDTDSALKKYPELFKEYFSELIPPIDNRSVALGLAVWSGGTLIYVPKGVKVDAPLQTYFRINAEGTEQFECTLTIVNGGADIHYVEGCMAPTYSGSSLRAAIVETFTRKDAHRRYTTIQNWSDNIYNLVTKRAKIHEGATVEWIDGNPGAKTTMKYPSIYLDGKDVQGTMLPIAFIGANQIQDTDIRMIHNAPNTSSSIVSKSISKDGGEINYRGQVTFAKSSVGSVSRIECDTIITDEWSRSDTILFSEIRSSQTSLGRGAKVSKISEKQLRYLMSRSLTRFEATEVIVMGFVEPFIRELPMEYVVELNRLVSYEMEGSVG